MPPQSHNIPTGALDDELSIIPDENPDPVLEERKIEINFGKIIRDLRNVNYSLVVWRNVFLFIILHIYGLCGVYLAITSCTWKTLIFSYVLHAMGALGITMGVHRLWSHRTYKANLPLRIILALFQSVAFQNSIYEWSRDHRVHHKYSETDADPHNAQRGFFFSHMGWLLMKKHPKVKENGRKVDMSDLMEDPVVYYQHKFYIPIMAMCCFVLPTFIPWYFWGEHILNAVMVSAFLRYIITLHITWTVNSLAHWVGSKPFDKGIYPSQNIFVAWFAFGEGWHNYHHVFPYDYRAAEFGGSFRFNATTIIIDFFAYIGWAYDRKLVSDKMYEQRAIRTGDGSLHLKHA